MNKIKLIGLLVLLIVSSLFHYTKASEISNKDVSYSVVYLEGAFLKEGEYIFYEELTIEDLINDVGVKKNANLDCLNLKKIIEDESSLYLPIKRDDVISLNHASKEELMTLRGVGEKTAQKIIDYRNEQEFTCLEDIMNIKGIGEKTFIRLRDVICL